MILTWLVAAATAQQPCDSSLDALLDDVGRVEAGLEAGQADGTVGAALRLRTQLSCLDERLPAMLVPRLFRAIGGGLLLQRHPESLGWLRSAASVDPGFEYTIDLLPEGSPLFEAWRQARDGMRGVLPETMAHRVFGPGVHWLDGRSLTSPVAVPGVPHVYQHQENAQAPYNTELVWGSDFPDAYVELQGVSEAPHVVLDNQPPALGEAAVAPPEVIGARSGRTARNVVLASGGTMLVTSGVLVGLSIGHRENAPRIADRLAVGAGASGAAGLLTLGIGVLLSNVDNDPRPTLDVRF